jgi:hypothetical protein
MKLSVISLALCIGDNDSKDALRSLEEKTVRKYSNYLLQIAVGHVIIQSSTILTATTGSKELQKRLKVHLS